MPTGTVKWFNNAKGYGFILPENGEADIFAHYSAIEMEGYKTLKAGQRVNFELIDGEKGKHATNISLASGSEPHASPGRDEAVLLNQNLLNPVSPGEE